MTTIVEQILELSARFEAHRVPHAFGGALALAFCTRRARGTIDIDLNVFVDQQEGRRVLELLPRAVAWDEEDAGALERDGQIRVWWDRTPLDLFLNTTEFHRQAGERAHREPFAGRQLPFLSCSDLAVFKAFFSRTKDWADIEEMVGAGSLDLERTIGVIARYLGPDDERIPRLLALAGPEHRPAATAG